MKNQQQEEKQVRRTLRNWRKNSDSCVMCEKKNMLPENSTKTQQRTGLPSEKTRYTLSEKEQK